MTRSTRYPDGPSIERKIREMLSTRRAGATICPSEVARALGTADWRTLMPPVREAAWRLEAAGKVAVLQRRQPVERDSVQGPIRIGLPHGSRGKGGP